jgi:Cu2+-exporting ATPase
MIAAAPVSAALPAEACFHCGLPLAGAHYEVAIDGRTELTCCRGCQAVVQAFVAHGLASYYRHRTAPGARVGDEDGADAHLALYDRPDVQRGFVRESGPDEREATLLLEGLTCAACAWVIERRLAKLAGVTGVEINYAARRGRVRWNVPRTQLSAILSAIAELGYRAHPYDGERANAVSRAERRTLLGRLAVAALGMMQVMMYAVPAYFADGDMEQGIEWMMQFAGLVLTLPVIAWSAAPFYIGAWRNMRSGGVGMDVPVTLGIMGAFAASVYAIWRGEGAVYFDSVTMFVFLLLGARYLELLAREKALQSQEALHKLAPAFAERYDRYPDPSRCEKVPVALLAPGDHVVVRPGGAIPVDGTVAEGESAADESLLTGEARPVKKRAGDPVIGGAINLRSPLVVRVERVGQDTALAGILRLRDEALAHKPAIAKAADRAARRFVAALLILTCISAGAWYAIDPARALWVAIALLVVSCPCALSLATPTALSAASCTLHRMGVLVRRGHALETLSAATHFVFDKTGTLTEGAMSLIGVIPLASERREPCLALAAALEARSEHPIGRAVCAAAGDSVVAGAVRSDAGRGMEGSVDGRRLRIGTPEFVAALSGRPLPEELKLVSDEVTTVALGDEREFIALLTFGDALRTRARSVVHELRMLGKTVCLLSGDRPGSVAYAARQLGIEIVRAGATPEAKLEFVRGLQAGGAVVAMIGDGVNDAPVLAGAEVSIALANGTALAQAGADMVLASGRLDTLVHAVRLARATRRVIRQNLAAAALYNAIALPLAALGHVTPVIAALGMSLSSLAVVGNAMRLLRPGGRAQPAPTAQAAAIPPLDAEPAPR